MTGTATWTLIGGCAAATVAIKAIGPLALGGRALPPWFASVVSLLAPALLTALVVTQAVAEGSRLTIGADTAGVVAAAVVTVRGGGVLAAVTVAVVVTAVLRATFP